LPPRSAWGIITLFWDDLLSNGLNASLLWGLASRAGNLRFFLGNMLSATSAAAGNLTTNSWAMLYGTLVMGLSLWCAAI
jgi:hypothetical protein